jgi:hypothetical protein
MAKEEYLKYIKEMIDNTAEDSIEYVKVWKEHVLFTWQWWFSLVLFIVPILGLFNSFVSEPLLRWLGIYVVVHWSNLISLPIYISLYLLADYFSKRNKMNNLDAP